MGENFNEEDGEELDAEEEEEEEDVVEDEDVTGLNVAERHSLPKT